MSRRGGKFPSGRKSVKRDESYQRDLGMDILEGTIAQPPFHNIAPANSETKDVKMTYKGRHRSNDHLKTLSEQLKEVRSDSNLAAASNIKIHGFQKEQMDEEVGARIERRTRFKRGKRRKLRSKRKTQLVEPSQDAGAENWEGGGLHEQNVTSGAPKSGCGILWNWSSIHLRGKSFLDIAGRSLSCGMSELKLKRHDLSPRGQDMPVMPDYSSSSTTCNQAQPLRVEASESHESTDYAAWLHHSSGELGIYPDNLLNHGIGSELALEARSDDHHKFRRHHGSRHQNLTQKYMPSSFRELVGQNLVTQALSNAVAKRKVGLLYVFYGPHGTGKTSCARIFAQALNCQSLELTKPCGFCNSCIAYTTGQSRSIREIGPIGNFDFEGIMDILDDMASFNQPSQYRVIIVDDCDTLTPDCWSSISKVVDRTPRHVVFVLVSSSLDVLPHTLIFRSQKFFFPKLKEAEMICCLQNIAIKEDLEIDEDALKLIASRSDGSMRDAEMTLEQLSLLGQRISVSLVQELVGLISDEKLVDLLDLALSADTVNTVKILREIMEAGVEPLALMSQLATLITDILAGTYDLEKERPRRKFFRRQALLNEDMEKLRQALKTLSDTEKQLRNSNDKLTWLTVAMLQLAPDNQFMLPSSLDDANLHYSPRIQNNDVGRERPRRSNVEMASAERLRSPRFTKTERLQAEHLSDVNRNANTEAKCRNRRRHDMSAMVSQDLDMKRMSEWQLSGRDCTGIEEIWFQVLEKIHISSIKEFMYQEGKLISVTFGGATTVQLMFSSQQTKTKAEMYREYILQLFESVLGSPVTIEIRCESKNDNKANMQPILQGHRDSSSHVCPNLGHMSSDGMTVVKYSDTNGRVSEGSGGLPEAESFGVRKSEITEVASQVKPKCNEHEGRNVLNDRTRFAEQIHSLSIGSGKKLEQENLKLESRSRSLGWWKASKVSQPKVSRLKIRTKRPKCSLRYVCCGRCSSTMSPR